MHSRLTPAAERCLVRQSGNLESSAKLVTETGTDYFQDVKSSSSMEAYIAWRRIFSRPICVYLYSKVVLVSQRFVVLPCLNVSLSLPFNRPRRQMIVSCRSDTGWRNGRWNWSRPNSTRSLASMKTCALASRRWPPRRTRTVQFCSTVISTKCVTTRARPVRGETRRYLRPDATMTSPRAVWCTRTPLM